MSGRLKQGRKGIFVMDLVCQAIVIPLYKNSSFEP